jgi:hypothetical protein
VNSTIDGALLNQNALQIHGGLHFLLLCIMGSGMTIVLKLAYHIPDTEIEDISHLQTMQRRHSSENGS